jgi:hypothetical protein
MISPWMQSFVLANANQAYSLYSLVAATFGSPPQPPKWQGISAQFLAIQVDPNNSASDVQLAIGNDRVTFTNCGTVIFAGQTFPIYSMEANLIDLKSVFLYANQPNTQVNISFLQR